MLGTYIHRKIESKFQRYFKAKQVVVVTGMRRVGKTTLLLHYFNKLDTRNKVFFDLEDILNRQLFEQENYQQIVSTLKNQGLKLTSPNKAYIFIDEIQYVPNLPSVIKYLYDKYQVKFIVTGSSSYYLKNRFTESLAGRKFVLELRPLTFQEFLKFKGIKKTTLSTWKEKVKASTDFDEKVMLPLYQEYIDYGGFPEVVLSPDLTIKKELLRDILNSYFQIDITTLARFKDVAKLRDLLILLSQRIGQKINITNLANQLKIPRTKVYEYLELLKSTYIIDTIPQKTSIDNQVSANDKLYFADSGLVRVLAEVSSGSLFENSIYMNLVYDYDLTYYQTKRGKEIDFVLNKQTGLEVKETPSRMDLANLKKRCQSAQLKECYLVGKHFTGTNNTILAWNL